ncbi:MAG TPA: hypothetical protein PLY93_07850, partial [Turneriella sp.]|nr:hypothetical protein [Turneriella sp.]
MLLLYGQRDLSGLTNFFQKVIYHQRALRLATSMFMEIKSQVSQLFVGKADVFMQPTEITDTFGVNL